MVNPSKDSDLSGFRASDLTGLARRIGHTAQEILRAPDFSGAVLAVVTNAVYLTTRDDEILWLAQEHLSAHPRVILASFDSSTMRAGMRVRAADERLMIGNVSIDLRDAEEWQPPTITQPAPLEFVSGRARAVRTVIARSVLSGALAESKDRNEAISEFVNEISRSARTDTLSHRNSQLAIRNLIGLGAGLTPAGDDFVGGLLFAVYHLQKIYSEIFYWDNWAIGELIEYARAQTNKISFAILRDLARGQGPEPLHDFMVTLLSEEKPNDLQSSVIRVLAIGHSTGHAMLDGVLTGIELMMNGRLN